MTTQPVYVRQDQLRQTSHAPVLALQMIGQSTPTPIRLPLLLNPKFNMTIQLCMRARIG